MKLTNESMRFRRQWHDEVQLAPGVEPAVGRVCRSSTKAGRESGMTLVAPGRGGLLTRERALAMEKHCVGHR